MKITIGWLYPDLMSTYGDRGNIISLEKRCQWRDIEAEVKNIELGTKSARGGSAFGGNLELRTCDLIFMGGAQDRQQKITSLDLRKNKGPVLKEMIENNIPGLFVCAAYQFMGHYYRPAEGEDIEGLHIFDLHTIHFGKDKQRCIGNIVIKLNPTIVKLFHCSIAEKIVGFENHGGRTYLGKDVKPLGEVVVGNGNNGDLPASRLDDRQVQAGDKTEGCVYKNAIGTYLHGPILPKNPHLADWLIKTALERKYQKEVKLKKLDDELELKAHDFIIKKYAKKNYSN